MVASLDEIVIESIGDGSFGFGLKQL